MYTPLLSIQRLEKSGNIHVTSLSAKHIQWTVVTNSRPTKIDKDYFPIRTTGSFKISKRVASQETNFCVNEQNNTFQFSDSYFGPAGTVFVIILPDLFITDILTFRDSPGLPVNVQGNIFSQVPGGLKIAYNNSIKRNCIIITLYQTVSFELNLRGKQVLPERFPHSERQQSANTLFDISLSAEFLQVDHITNNDLMIINSTAAQINIDQLRDAFEEILVSVRARDEARSNSALTNLKNLLVNSLGAAGSLVTLIDSYNNTTGIAHLFIGQVLKLIQ